MTVIAQHIEAALDGSPVALLWEVMKELDGQMERGCDWLRQLHDILWDSYLGTIMECFQPETNGDIDQAILTVQVLLAQALHTDHAVATLSNDAVSAVCRLPRPPTVNLVPPLLRALDPVRLLSSTLSCSADAGEVSSLPPFYY
jgi:hypothetical protein